jgi:hypothetical protein
MTIAKSGYIVDLRGGANGTLEAQSALQRVDNSRTFHVANNLRPALGIYNVSTSRVFQKVEDVSERIEALLASYQGGESARPPLDRSKLERSLIDYIELLFYAAADHVDDLMLICDHFYASPSAAKRDRAHRKFRDELKQHKRFVSAVANHIKHSQHRIRLYHAEFVHAGHAGVMCGYVVEGVENGVVGPSPVFHSSHHSVFSAAALPWQVIIFVLSCSRSLNEFLKSKVAAGDTGSEGYKQMIDAIIATARLPFYTMDEDDYMQMSAFSLGWDKAVASMASSGLYGSLANEWEHANNIQFGRHGASFAGDGITRTFKMLISPSKVTLRRVNKI